MVVRPKRRVQPHSTTNLPTGISMKTSLYLAAAAATLLMASSAQARGISFNIDGQKIRIEAPRNCSSMSCISVTSNGSTLNMKNMNRKGRGAGDVVEVASNEPQVASPAQATQAPAVPAPVANAAPPASPPAAANNLLPAPAAEASRERVTAMPAPASARASTAAEQLAQLKKLDEATTPPPAQVANAASPAPSVQPVQQEAAATATTPFGLWKTDEGNVRVEQCGANLCGYGEKNGKKSDELVLINMKPSRDHSQWTGRVHNPNDGKNYDATATLKGPNQLRVQGCALGGMICGSTTWKRIS
jgi:uncharacterized protein (DUF2147 family)